MLSALWKAISQAVHHSPVDWLLFGGFVLFGVVLIVIAFLLSPGKESALELKDGTLPTVRRQSGVFQTQKLKIISAEYGFKEKWADVTETLQNLIVNDTLSVLVGNELFGDPAEGKAKRLKLSYSYGSSAVVKIVRYESNRMVLPEDSYLKERATDPSIGLFDQLQLKAFHLANDMREFVNNFEPQPPPIDPHTQDVQARLQVMVERTNWRQKIWSAYELKFAEQIQRLKLEFSAKGVPLDLSQCRRDRHEPAHVIADEADAITSVAHKLDATRLSVGDVR